MEKVAVYARVSTEEQRERQSIETQIEYAKQYCQGEGCLIADFYCDNGVSGTIPFEEREAGNRLFRDAREGKFKSVLVYKIDRIGRENLVTLNAVFKLTKLGIDIKSMTELSDRSNPQGRFIFNLFANLAEWEKEQIRERTIDGKYRKARLGKFQGGGIPCGYLVNKEKFLQINETPIPGFDLSPSEVVRQIFNWIGKEGVSTIAVAGKLNELGIPSPKGITLGGEFLRARWTCTQIRRIVINPVYKGTNVYGKQKLRSDNTRESVSISVQPIVDEELWLKAQETLKLNRNFSKRNSKQEYLLRGLIKCNFCGHSYVGQALFARNRYYYRCICRIGSYKKSYHDCPGRGKTVRRDWIDGVVWDQIKNWILNPVILEEIVSAKLKEYEKEKGNSFSTYSKLRDSLEKKKHERIRILELFRRGTITTEHVEEQLNAIDSEEKSLIQMAEEIKSRMIKDWSCEGLFNSLKDEIKAYAGKLEHSSISFEDKRRIIEKFVKEVRVNMSVRRTNHSSLVETIPVRNNAESITLKDASVLTVYSRDKNTNDGSKLEADNSANFADVIYHFPFPPKELGVIVNPVL